MRVLPLLTQSFLPTTHSKNTNEKKSVQDQSNVSSEYLTSKSCNLGCDHKTSPNQFKSEDFDFDNLRFDVVFVGVEKKLFGELVTVLEWEALGRKIY